MRITILANKDLAANYALNLLLPQLKEHQVNLFLSTRVGSAKLVKPQALIDMAAMEHQLLESLEGGKGELKSFNELNSLLTQPYQMLDNINRPAGLLLLQSAQPELIISIRFGKILKDQAISCATQGVINLHSGLLPQYRGVMATFWAMLQGEKTVGSTLHYVPNSGIDTGDIIGQSSIDVDTSKSYQWHVLKLYQQGCQQISETAQSIASGKSIKTMSQPKQGNYFSYPTEQDLQDYLNQGLILSDQRQLQQFFKN